jgi:hypothetical protein
MDHFSRHCLQALSFIMISPLTVVVADELNSAAHAAYPQPFSRPASMGKDYDTWRDAKGPDICETIVDAKRLPSRVDNSTRPQFPPIYKQKGGACGPYIIN